jgi:hypothetical protein
MRKDPGSREWHFVRAMSDEEMRTAHQRYLEEMVAKHGNEPRDIMVQVNDSLDASRLERLGIGVRGHAPYTLSTRVLYRQLPEMKRAGLLYWGKNSPQPIHRPDVRDSWPVKPAEPTRDGTPWLPTPPPRPMVVDGVSSTQTVTIWSEGFETNQVPGTYWSTGDLNPNTGHDYWGDRSSGCGAWIRSGAWSAACNGNLSGDFPSCTQYVDDQDAYVQNPGYFPMSGYSTYDALFYLKYQTEPSYDYFWWAYSTGGGWIQAGGNYSGSGDWTQLGVTISNATHSADNFAFQFRFFSDFSNTDVGAFVDDVLLRGDPLQPNLTYYTPSGWSGPIVPSSIQFTSTTGTLYAGQPTYIDWAVQNNGVASAAGFDVNFYLDGGYIGSNHVASLTNGTYWYSPDWSYTVQTPGTHTLQMTIDPSGTVGESNEGDNTFSSSFYWNPAPPPDLIVQSVVPSSSFPAVGSTISATVTIKNQGTGTANGTFYTYFYKNPGSAPTQGQLGYDDSHPSFSLAPGASESYVVQGLTSSLAVPWTMYAYVDATNAITNESSEANNRTASSVVNWTSGTVTVSGVFAYDDSLLGPNTPMRCAHVVLVDVDPPGTPGSANGEDIVADLNTDATGHFGPVTIPNQDTDGDQGRLDLYARVFVDASASCLGSYATAVHAYAGDPAPVWFWQSPTVTDIPNGAYSFGTVKPSGYVLPTAAHLYATVLRGYDYVRALGATPPFVDIRWSPGEGFVTAYVSGSPQRLWIQGDYSCYALGGLRLWPDDWDDAVILHEYGHAVADAFGFKPTFPPGTSLSHAAFKEAMVNGTPSRELAWSEGWAWYFAAQVLGRNVLVNTGDSLGCTAEERIDVESGTYWDSVSGVTVNANERGPTWEIPNAGILWDIADAANDNPNGDRYADRLTSTPAAVWDAVKNPGATHMTSADSFYVVYQPRYASGATQPTLFEALNEVYCEHGACAQSVGVTSGGNPLSWGRVEARPNPFYGRARIALRVPPGGGGTVTLRVYDVGGQVVRSLMEGPVDAGELLVPWDGRSDRGRVLPAGIYYGHLSGKGTDQVFKLVLLR